MFYACDTVARSRPARNFAESKRDRYCDTGEASRLLDGLLSPNQIRLMALRGEISGAIKAPGVKKHVLIPRHVVPSLLLELEFSAQPAVLHRPAASTFDAPSRWASG